jgi:hypothetical protein
MQIKMMMMMKGGEEENQELFQDTVSVFTWKQYQIFVLDNYYCLFVASLSATLNRFKALTFLFALPCLLKYFFYGTSQVCFP